MSLQKYSHEFFEIADECECPRAQINALTRAIVTYSDGIKLTQKTADNLNKHNIKTVQGQRLTSVIDQWSRNVNLELREHPHFNRKFAKLCDALARADAKPQTADECVLIPKSKPKKEKYKKACNSTWNLDDNLNDNRDETQNCLECIQIEIERYNSYCGIAGYETAAARGCLDAIMDLCGTLAKHRTRLELGE